MLGSVTIEKITSTKAEIFYWVTILFSKTLGTALGDFLADTIALGYDGEALVFSATLAVVAGFYFYMNASRPALFWAAFIVTRPLGATVGDLVDRPVAEGGMTLSRFSAAAFLTLFIVACVLLLPQKAEDSLGSVKL